MKLEHPDLAQFEPFLRQVVDIAFNSGTKALQSKGFRFDDLGKDTSAVKVFVRGCHYGYDKAQQRICTAVVHIARNINEEETRLKELRRQRKHDTRLCIERIQVLKDRQLILRRILDTMVWTIVGPEEWIVRRLGDDRIRSIDVKVLERTAKFALSKNQDSRNNFNLISDLCTVIHMGDIFEVTWSSHGKAWRILELKEGKVNALLNGILEDRSEPLDQDIRQVIEQTVGKDGVKQAERMLRQKESLTQFSKLIETDCGADFRTKSEIRLTPEVAIVDDYYEEVSALIEKAATEGFASMTIDRSLHLITMKGDLYKGRRHLVPLFHLLSNPTYYDQHRDTNDVVAEYEQFAQWAPIVDMVDLNMRIPCAKPIFYWLPISQSKQIDMAMGRIRIFGLFDIQSFVKHLGNLGITTSWVAAKEDPNLRILSARIPGSPNAYGVKVKCKDGTVQTLMNGFFSRIYLYLTKPSALVKLIGRMREEMDKTTRPA